MRARSSRRIGRIAAHLAAGDDDGDGGGGGKKKPTKSPLSTDELLEAVQGEWVDQKGTVIEIADDVATVHQRGSPQRWPISVQGDTLFFGGSHLRQPHDVDSPQWIFEDGPTMTWKRLPSMEEFTSGLAPVENFQTQSREVFFGRRGLALTHIVLFSDSQSPAHAAAHDAMRDAYASYAGSAMNIWM